MKQKLLTLFALLLCVCSGAWADDVIWESDFVESISGVTQTKGRNSDTWGTTESLNWAKDTYSNVFNAGGSASTLTLAFATPISVPANAVMHIYWGATSNRTLSLKINGSDASFTDGSVVDNTASKPRSTIMDATYKFTSTTSLSSFLIGTNGSGTYWFHVSIVASNLTQADAPAFTPDGGAVNGGTTVNLTSEALNVYYQWSDTEVDLTTASEGWNSGTSVAVPNENGTKYLYAYATNGTGLESAVVHKAFTITAVSIFNWGLTQNDLTSSTGITTTTTYSDNKIALVSSNAAMSGSSGTRSLTNGTSSVTAAATACQRNNLCSGASDFIEASYYAFTLTPEAGYMLNISKIFGDLYYDSSRSGKYKFAVYSGDTKLWEASSSDYVTIGGSNNSQKTLDVSGVDALQGLKSSVQVRMVWYQNGSSSYVALKDFNITASVDEYSATQHAVTTSVNNSDMGSVTETANYVEGTNVVITATPNTGYKFTSWTIDGVENASTENPYTFTNISAAHTIQAVFAARKTISFNVTDEQKGTRADVLGTEYADANDKFVAPSNKYLSSANQTLTGWNDGTSDYAVGTEIDLASGNKTLTPVFAANDGADFAATLDASKSDFEVTWGFGNADVALNIEGFGVTKTGFYVKQATINGKVVDMPIAIDATDGKLNNGSNVDCAQFNNNTKLTVPVVKNSVISLKGYNNISTTTINGSTEYTGTGTKNVSYTYTGETGTIDIVSAGEIGYLYDVTVTYPSAFSAKPELTSEFSFANKAYAVTIASVEGVTNIQTSTDNGANWTDNTEFTSNAITVNVTAGQTLKARAIVGTKTASEEVSFTNSFDPVKNYVAYVYQTGYSDSSVDYDFATDELAIALAADYNVVEVSLAQGDDPTTATDMNNADAIVLTEAVKGSNTATDMSNKMKEYVGNVPMVGMKMFAYTYNSTASKNRWGWGTASNNAGVNAFTPKNTTYKLFDGVTFEANGTIKLATATSGNILQSVDFTTPATPLSPNTIMGTVDGVDTKAVLHTTTKYLGIGISCNVRETYTENLSIIVKNAIEMLLSGEALDATDANISRKVTGTIAASGMCTLASTLPVDLSTLASDEAVTAYYASEASGSTVTLTTTTATVPAGEGLVISGTANKAFTVDVAASGTAIDGNLLKAGDGTTEFDGTTYDYLLFSDGKFYQIGSGTVAVGKAYLHLNAAPSAKALSIVFNDGETTNISNLNANGNLNSNATRYNLAGQKVNNSYKGIVIKNGKKYIIK